MEHRPVILIVEDDPASRRMLRALLEGDGYVVADAMDGRSAIRAIEVATPHLVVMDLRLPDCRGADLAVDLRNILKSKDLPIIAVSGVSFTLDTERNSDSPFTDFLLKPVEPQKFLDIIRGYAPSPGCEAASPGGGRLVLVADDDPLFRRLFQVQLQRAGYHVETVADGHEAISRVRELRPACVVSDALLPGADGIRLCREIWEDEGLRGTPVVLISSEGADPARLAPPEELGAAAVVRRQRDPQPLLDAVRGAVDPESSARRRLRPPRADATQWRAAIVRDLEQQAAMTAELSRVSRLQAAELSVLAGISEMLLQAEGLRGVLDEALVRCLDLSVFSLGAAYVMEEDAGLVLAAHRGFPEGVQSRLRDCFGCLTLLADALRSDEPIAVPSTQVPRLAGERLLRSLAANSVMLVPLSAGRERLGTVVLAAIREDIPGRGFAFARTIQGQLAQGLLLARTMQRLALSELRFRTVAESILEGLVVTDEHGGIVYANRTARALFGLQPGRERTFTAAQLLPGFRNLEGVWDGVAQSPGGRRFPVTVSTSAAVTGVGGLARTHLIQDTTERKRQEDYLVRLANQDPLTGLANRRCFLDELDRVLGSPETMGRGGAVLYMDLDGFKSVNDKLGHAVGDELLQRIAQGLQARLRGSDVVARLGGDEFAILHRRAGRAQAEALARVVRGVVAGAARGSQFSGAHVSASVGIALYPEHGRTSETLVRRADRAMYDAKVSSAEGIVTYADASGAGGGDTLVARLADDGRGEAGVESGIEAEAEPELEAELES
jgi:diguanylate cyclase (GGDEF)-like protein